MQQAEEEEGRQLSDGVDRASSSLLLRHSLPLLLLLLLQLEPFF
jgi:hypothetical protein